MADVDDINAALRAGEPVWGYREGVGELRLIPPAERTALKAGKDGIARRMVPRTHRRVSSRPARFWTGLRLGKPTKPTMEAKAAAETYRTGLPGRASSRHLIEAEFLRRCQAGIVAPTLSSEAEALSKWLLDAHPAAAQATPKTIRNRLGRLYRQHARK